jgi:hypothetical protein
MSYKMSGIDVHKKVLMVVVMETSTPGVEARTATICLCGSPILCRFAESRS